MAVHELRRKRKVNVHALRTPLRQVEPRPRPFEPDLLELCYEEHSQDTSFSIDWQQTHRRLHFDATFEDLMIKLITTYTGPVSRLLSHLLVPELHLTLQSRIERARLPGGDGISHTRDD